ncbi:MAG: sigma-54 dependent transcriptional regulator [Candidatus Kapabacteria bacterium]|nr:sigma-54 dependent transcriptional regulator [Candidatus Kapabacteria bacterium]
MKNFKIILVDDEDNQRIPIKGFLENKGYKVFDFSDVDSAVSFFKKNQIDLIISDLKMPGKTGKELLLEVKAINPEIAVIISTAYGEIDDAVNLMKYGAADFIQKPIELNDLLELIAKTEDKIAVLDDNKSLLDNISSNKNAVSFSSIIYSGSAMEEVLSIASRVADSKASVLIRGESGTGKELIARAIHDASNRQSNPFVVVNCAALPETLFESELFGNEKGAFTGAVKSRIGKFEQADTGTLFIDEVGDIPLAVQVKMLRVLQFGEIERLGGDKTIKTDVRIVSATNRNLEEMISNKEFREDLLYRLNVVTIEIPPLRKRRSDIKPLIEYFLKKYSEINGRKINGLDKEATDLLMKYNYPGNIRELENIIQRAVVISRRNIITIDDLPKEIAASNLSASEMSDETCFELGDLNLKVEQLESVLIRKALAVTGGNQVKAADILNIGERTIRYKISKYGIK